MLILLVLSSLIELSENSVSAVSSSDQFIRARLASFDDSSIPDSAGQEFGTNAVFAGPQLHDKPDDLPWSDKPASDNFYNGQAPILTVSDHQNRMDKSSDEVFQSMDVPNFDGDQETWLAPFHDYDLDIDSGRTLSKEEMLRERNECLKAEAERRHMAFMASLTPRERLFDAAVKMQAVVKFTRLQRLKKRARWATKKFIVFMLSHVGLTSLVGLYAVAGGFIFQSLERTTGQDHVRPSHTARNVYQYRKLDNVNNETFLADRDLHVELLWNQTLDLNVLEPALWKAMASKFLLEYEKSIYKAIIENVTEERVEQNKVTEKPSEWTYPISLLFAVTVITTIGYGDVVPKSDEAKLMCMLYAVIGIPLTLLCLANIGSLLASVYRFTWKHASHLALVLARAPERNKPLVPTREVRVPITVSVTTMVVYILGGAAIFSKWEDWSFLDGSYFCFITLSTIGFGDYVPGQDTETLESNIKRVVCALYLLFGLALLSMIFQLIQDSVTLVVRRYASFLGLSKAKIEQDILDCSLEADLDKGALESAAEFTSFTRSEGKLREGGHEGTVYPARHSEGDIALNAAHESLGDASMEAHFLHRAKSLPARDKSKKRLKTVPRLQIVPEEIVARRNSSSCPGESQHSPNKEPGEQDTVIVPSVLCRKNSAPAVTVSDRYFT